MLLADEQPAEFRTSVHPTSREARGRLESHQDGLPSLHVCECVHFSAGASVASLNSQKNPLHTLLHPPPRSRTTTLGYLHTSPCWVTVLPCPLVGRQATLASPGEGAGKGGGCSLTALSASFPSPSNTPSTWLRHRLYGRGICGDILGSLMGRSVSHQNPSLRAHQIFMAIKRPNFLPREEPKAQSTASQTRRGSLGTAPSGSLKSPLWRAPQARGSLQGERSGSDQRTASSHGHARRKCPQPADRCVHPLNNLHPPGNGPRRCQSH